MITLSDLSLICQHAHTQVLARFADPLHDAMQEFGIQTTLREAAFIAQVSQESGEFQYVHELASGAAYEGRKDLGNTQLGDGMRFKGRGLIQITGRAGYEACAAALGLPLVDNPGLLEQPVNACRSAAWWWEKHGLNQLADVGAFGEITKRINGQENGPQTHEAERLAYYAKAKSVLGIVDPAVTTQP